MGALLVNDAQVTGVEQFAVGQYLKLRPHLPDVENKDIQISWMLSPNTNEPFEQGDGLLVWRPTMSREYTVDISVKRNSGEQASRQFTFACIPADVRYSVWGNSQYDVQLNETVNGSEPLGWDGVYRSV